MSVLPSLLVLFVAAFLFRPRLLWGVWVLVTLLMMLLTVVHVRYFLQVLPLLLYGCWLTIVWLNRRSARTSGDAARRGGAVSWGRVASAAIVVAWVGLNVVRVASLVVEQRRTPFLARYRDGKYAMTPGVAEVLRSQTPEGAWVLVPQKYGRILTYSSRRNAVEPGPVTNLDPAEQPVYVLEPMDAVGQEWMSKKSIAAGPAVGQPVRDRRGKEWQLRRAVRAPAPPAAVAPPAGSTPS